MGLSGARNSAVTGLQAQSTSISISADNIANAATPGYKAVKSQFSTLVTTTDSSAGYSSGGVSVSAQNLIEKQGLIENTGRVTDLAISGSGFFAVQDSSGVLQLTRAGSFDINNKGELVNPDGLQLLAWPLDNDGRKPGATGNINTTAAESTSSLVIVDTNSASGTASATTSISAGLNLNAGESVYQGATLTLDPQSTANSTISQDDIVVPAAGMEEGDQMSFTSNGLTSTFTYGGFAKSGDCTTAAIYGATTTAATFTTGTSLANTDQFTITTSSSGTVTFTFVTSNPAASSGQFNSLDTLATAINSTTGLTARTSGGHLYVSSTDASESITFDDVGSSNMAAELGFSDELAAGTGVLRWNTFAGLETLVDSQSQLNATINSPASGATIDIYASDPQSTMTATKLDNTAVADLQSDENGTNASTDLIVPVSGTAMAAGDTVVFEDDQAGGGNTVTATYGGFAESNDITVSSIFGASTATGAFADAAWDDGDQVTFTTGSGTVIVTYRTTPALATEFNSLTTLASAINSDTDFVSRVANNKLYISSADATDLVSYAVTTDPGADLTTAYIHAQLGGTFTAAGSAVLAAGAGTFNTMAQLQAIIDADVNFTATLANAAANSTITISSATSATGLVVGNSSDDLIKELGIADNHNIGDDYFAEFGADNVIAAADQTASIAVTYNPNDSTKNMSGGNVSPAFSRNIEVYDALGTGHDFRLSFLKTGVNTWATEFYSLAPAEVSGSTDGLIVSGTVVFNGDGSLNSASTALTTAFTIPWTTGAISNTIQFTLGTEGQPAGTSNATSIGGTDGLRQFNAAYNVEFIDQNGVAAGQFKGITVSEDGTINANFSNGEIKPIYKLPIITVANQNALSPQTGNTFIVTQESGEVNLKDAGSSGAGTVVAGALEGSTSDIAEELTRTIGIQSNYNANATLISTVRSMEDELNRRL